MLGLITGAYYHGSSGRPFVIAAVTNSASALQSSQDTACVVLCVLMAGATVCRDAEGRPSCIRDECAHRACPLSLGEVVDGKVGGCRG